MAEQIVRPDYQRKRFGALAVIETVAVVIPQTVQAVEHRSVLRLGFPVAMAVLITVALLTASRGGPKAQAIQGRLLAYHGVTADGEVTAPVSAWKDNPLGRLGLVLLCLQILIFTSGVVTAAHVLKERRACGPVPAADAQALTAVFGIPSLFPVGTLGTTLPIVARNAPLIGARQIDAGFGVVRGLHYVAAYTQDLRGRRVGPAVWEIVEPTSRVALSGKYTVTAQDPLARKITPSTPFSTSARERPMLVQARDCARAAA